MSRSRKAVAAACVALVVIAALFPLGGASLGWLIVAPDFILLPPPEAERHALDLPRRFEQPLALRSSGDGRAPPRDSSAL